MTLRSLVAFVAVATVSACVDDAFNHCQSDADCADIAFCDTRFHGCVVRSCAADADCPASDHCDLASHGCAKGSPVSASSSAASTTVASSSASSSNATLASSGTSGSSSSGSSGSSTGTGTGSTSLDTTSSSGSASSGAGSTGGTGGPPVISGFAATPEAITIGDEADLSWTVTAADTLTLAPVNVSPQGSGYSVAPVETTTYTLTASNGFGSVHAQTTVTVYPDVTVSLSPDGGLAQPGERIAFAASVAGSADQAVTFSIAEPGAQSSITASGVLTAALSPESFHVRATSDANPTRYGEAEVTVYKPASGELDRTFAEAGVAYFAAEIDGGISATCAEVIGGRFLAIGGRAAGINGSALLLVDFDGGALDGTPAQGLTFADDSASVRSISDAPGGIAMFLAHVPPTSPFFSIRGSAYPGAVPGPFANIYLNTSVNQSNAAMRGGLVLDGGVIFEFGGGATQPIAVKYRVDGGLVTEFGTNGNLTYSAPYIHIDDAFVEADGTIELFSGHGDGLYLDRISASGTMLASSPGIHFGAVVDLQQVRRDRLGRSIATGTLDGLADGGAYSAMAVAVAADGGLDTSFGNDGLVVFPHAGFNTTLQFSTSATHDYFACESNGPAPCFIAGTFSDGTIDTSFGNQGILDVTFADGSASCAAVVVDPNGKLDVVATVHFDGGSKIGVQRFWP